MHRFKNSQRLPLLVLRSARADLSVASDSCLKLVGRSPTGNTERQHSASLDIRGAFAGLARMKSSSRRRVVARDRYDNSYA